MKALATLCLLAVATTMAFLQIMPSNSIRKQRQYFIFEQYSTFTSSDGERSNSTNTNVLMQFFQGWFNIFSPVEKKNTAKITNLSGYKSSYTSGLRNKKDASYWRNQEIVDDFVAKYLGNNVKEKSNTKKLLGQLSKLNDEEELLDSLDEYSFMLRKSKDDPFTASERFISDTLIEMAKPMTTQIDKAKIIKPSMKFPKPMKLAKLVKKLKGNPNYFK